LHSLAERLLKVKLRTTLKHIASIQTGIFAKTGSTGDIVYLQAKHFNDIGILQSKLHPDLKADKTIEKHLLRDGDVLFAAKGSKNFATVYESHNEPAVASTSFFIIRLNELQILPEFLVWLINHPSSQKFLKGNAIGTSIASISKTVLEDLEIYIPTIQTQKAVLQITQLRNKEKSLQKSIEFLREKQIQQLIKDAIK